MARYSISSTGAVRVVTSAMAAAVALILLPNVSFAYTYEQKMACMPDAFRLCSNEIPNIPGITACMRRQKADLSPACKAVFDKNLEVVATRQRD